MRCGPGPAAPLILSIVPCASATPCDLVVDPIRLVPVPSRPVRHSIYPDPTGDFPLVRSAEPDDPCDPPASRRVCLSRIEARTGQTRASRVDPFEALGYHEPVWSPDGQIVVFRGRSGHVVLDATTLETLAERPGHYPYPPAFDADGARICLSRWSGPVEIARVADILAAWRCDERPVSPEAPPPP